MSLHFKKIRAETSASGSFDLICRVRVRVRSTTSLTKSIKIDHKSLLHTVRLLLEIKYTKRRSYNRKQSGMFYSSRLIWISHVSNLSVEWPQSSTAPAELLSTTPRKCLTSFNAYLNDSLSVLPTSSKRQTTSLLMQRLLVCVCD